MARKVIIVHPRESFGRACENDVLEYAKRRHFPVKELHDRFEKLFDKYEADQRAIILPSTEHDLSKPNLSVLYKRLKLRKGDVVLSDFNPESRLLASHYPDFEKVFNRLERELKLSKDDELVFGGFSSSDCVTKLALVAHSLGYKAFIDSEITEQFAPRIKLELTGEKHEPWIKRVPIDPMALWMETQKKTRR
jgi:hypothetical protein